MGGILIHRVGNRTAQVVLSGIMLFSTGLQAAALAELGTSNLTQKPRPTKFTPANPLQANPTRQAAADLLPARKTEPQQQNIDLQNKRSYLVIRLSDRRVYLYRNHKLAESYPIAVGREGWETPTGEYQIIQMVRNPAWQHPFTGEIIPPGPDNPLGERWIGFWTDGTNYIGFHGTPNEETVGNAASHGCIRMFNQDVLALFEQVTMGTPVIVEP
ncbi:MAG: L,D-transpeptidase [Microcoleaceae cyanobacterium]